MPRQRKSKEITFGRYTQFRLNGGLSGSHLELDGYVGGRVQKVLVPQLSLHEVKNLVQAGLRILDGVVRDAARLASAAREKSE